MESFLDLNRTSSSSRNTNQSFVVFLGDKCYTRVLELVVPGLLEGDRSICADRHLTLLLTSVTTIQHEVKLQQPRPETETETVVSPRQSLRVKLLFVVLRAPLARHAGAPVENSSDGTPETVRRLTGADVRAPVGCCTDELSQRRGGGLNPAGSAASAWW